MNETPKMTRKLRIETSPNINSKKSLDNNEDKQDNISPDLKNRLVSWSPIKLQITVNDDYLNQQFLRLSIMKNDLENAFGSEVSPSMRVNIDSELRKINGQ